MMRWLREQVDDYRRERRKGRERMVAEGLRPLRTYEKLLMFGGVVLGLYLLISGDTVERLIGAGMVASVVGPLSWAVVKVLREGKWRDDE